MINSLFIINSSGWVLRIISALSLFYNKFTISIPLLDTYGGKATRNTGKPVTRFYILLQVFNQKIDVWYFWSTLSIIIYFIKRKFWERFQRSFYYLLLRHATSRYYLTRSQFRIHHTSLYTHVDEIDVWV